MRTYIPVLYGMIYVCPFVSLFPWLQVVNPAPYILIPVNPLVLGILFNPLVVVSSFAAPAFCFIYDLFLENILIQMPFGHYGLDLMIKGLIKTCFRC